MTYSSFEKLEVWRRACRLAVEVVKMFKGSKDYVLKDQMGRAAISIASNIAEGAERGSKAEFVRFLNIAKGSAAELRTQLYIVQGIGHLVPDQKIMEMTSELKQISKMLHGLIRSQKEN